MAPAHSDRNLLFGLLALQMDFIDRDRLVAAMNAWAVEKEKPIGRILADQGAITEHECELLDGMVAAHVRRHGDDPSKSVQSLTSLVADPLLMATIDHAAPAEGTRHFPPATPTGSRFEIIRPHAEGGLGQVYVARDAELGRTVALKQIRSEHRGRESIRTRFVLEAEINGNLEHPGIVPVYGLGTDAEGRPFYAMRFIRGDSFKDAIEAFHREPASDHPLRLRQLLGRFVAVCQAVAYAHSRGVIHRDLKPANVMLGKFGETLIIDWGLAKVLGRRESSDAEDTLIPPSGQGGGLTSVGGVMGSPPFMSPEQAEGRDDVGPATDIYGLGAILYEVLTDRPPVTGPNASEILDKVRRGEVTPPREVRPRIHKSLDAVCRKALAFDPANRYPSAGDLAEDVERWLADEPVSARRENRTQRSARWMRKHRSATRAAVALVVIAAAAVTAAVLIDDARRREGAALVAERSAKAEADRERERAEANFSKARQAVDEYYTEVSENTLLNRQDSHDLRELRKALLEHALRYYESFTDQGGDDPAFREDLAEAYSRVGSIRNEIGSREQGLEAYLRELAIRRDLVRENPDSPQRQAALSSCLASTAMLQRETGRLDDMLRSERESLEIAERLARDHPDESQHRTRYAHGLNGMAVLLNDLGQYGEATDYLRRAIAEFEAMIEANPKDELRDSLAGCWLNLGQWQTAGGEVEEGIRTLEKARAVFEEMAEKYPKREEYQLSLAGIEMNLGGAYGRLGRNEEALASAERCRERMRAFVKAHPSVSMYRSSLAKALDNVGDALLTLDRPEEALRAYEEARGLFADLFKLDPTVMEYRRDLANNLDLVGHALLRLGRGDEALASFEKSRDAWIPLIRDIDNPAYRGGLIHALGHVHDLRSRKGDFAAAIDALAASADQMDVLVAGGYADVNLKRDQLLTLGQLADLLRTEGRSEEAVTAYRRLLEAFDTSAGAFPAEVLGSLRGTILNSLGVALNDLGRREESLEVYRDSVKLHAALAEADPGSRDHHREQLAVSHYNVGNTLGELRRPEESLPSYQAAAGIFRELLAGDAGRTEARALLGATLNNMGNALASLGRLDEAEKALSEAIEHQQKALDADPDNARFKEYMANHRASLEDVLKAKRRDE